MAVIKIDAVSGFYNSVDGDRKYNADDMSRPYKRLISEGVFATPQGTPSTDLQVNSANNGMEIIVKKGEGLLGGKWFELPEDAVITVPENGSTYLRLDSVFVRVDTSLTERSATIQYRTGGLGAPELVSDDNITELRVAIVAVPPNAAYISPSNITDARGASECPWITSLIQQVDTSELFTQYRAAYEQYFDEAKASFDSWLASVAESMSPYVNIISFSSSYEPYEEVTSRVPIGIPSYQPNNDVLAVFVNGMRLIPNIDYIIDEDGAYITLTSAVKPGNTVSFEVLKSTVIVDPAFTADLIRELDQKVDEKTSDTGWQNLVTESGYTSGDLLIRRIGRQVSISGVLMGDFVVPSTIATIPESMCPPVIQYRAANIVTSEGIESCMLEFKPTGQIVFAETNKNTYNSARLYIAVNYII